MSYEFASKSNYKAILDQVLIQVHLLEMPYKAIARRSGVSLATVKRILAGDYAGARFDHILKICACVGIRLSPHVYCDADRLRREQAAFKARKVTGQVQATSALEEQGLEQETLGSMEERLVNKLLAGSSRDLWDE